MFAITATIVFVPLAGGSSGFRTIEFGRGLTGYFSGSLQSHYSSDSLSKKQTEIVSSVEKSYNQKPTLSVMLDAD
jgi:hypothetical protein